MSAPRRCPMSMHHAPVEAPAPEPVSVHDLPGLLELLDRSLDPRTGFLPSRTPVTRLPAPFDRISEACAELAQRYHGETLDVRPWLDSLFGEPMDWSAALDPLDGHTVQSVMTQTSILCHAYRWQSMPTRPDNYHLKAIDLPPALDALWTELAAELQIPRVGVFYTMVCNNWRLAGHDQDAPYSLEALIEEDFELGQTWLTGQAHDELKTFVFAALGTEALGARAVEPVQRIYRGILADNPARVAFGLRALEQVLGELVAHFNRQIRRQKIRPHSFMTLLQPTMIWMLDHGDGPLEGASGPQCVTVQWIDNVLGVPRESSLGPALLASRRYMLPGHRALVEAFDGAQHIVRDFVARSGDPSLREAYDACLATMQAWRRSHQARGAMYLKGEKGQNVDHYASTGLVVELETDRVDTFKRVMQDHADENASVRVGPADPTASFGGVFLALAERACPVRRVPPGEVLVRRGEHAPGLFLVVGGTAGVYRSAADHDSRLASLETGEIIGEISFLEHVPATADVVAETELAIRHLSVDEAHDLLESDPRRQAAFYRRLAGVLAGRLRDTSRACSHA